MIKLIDSFYADSDFFSTKITAEAAAYSGLGCFSLYSVGEGVLSVLDDNATLFGAAEDKEELEEFLQAIGAKTLLSQDIGFDYPAERLNIMWADKLGQAADYPLSEAPAVYEALKNGEDGDISLPDYAAFALDYSLRCRRGVGFGIVKDGAVAVASCVTKNAAILSGAATPPNMRGKGLGAAAVRALRQKLGDREMYLICGDKTVGFYEKLGFSLSGKAVRYDLRGR